MSVCLKTTPDAHMKRERVQQSILATTTHCHRVLDTAIQETTPLIQNNDYINSLIDKIHQSTAYRMIEESKRGKRKGGAPELQIEVSE